MLDCVQSDLLIMNERQRTVSKTHNHSGALTPENPRYRKAIQAYLLAPLLADLEGGGDITSNVLLSSENIKGVIISKEEGILAGMQELSFFLDSFPKVRIANRLDDGADLRKGSIVAVLEGEAREMLRLERTILNFLQHMCGVATAANSYVRKLGRFPVLVCPTRKTPWGLLDKRACVVGGAGTHRLNLSDAVLVKDTHLDLLGHDYQMLANKLAAAENLGRFVEIEVESIEEGRKAAAILNGLQKHRSIPCFIMLDNMKPSDIRKFVKELRSSQDWRNILVEASGGINLKNISEYAPTGVDVLSVGAMTHSAKALDISLKIAL